jgi:hypothetical protein
MNGKRLCSLTTAVVLLVMTAPALATSNSGWTEPINLSDWQDSIDLALRLELGADGTQAAFWARWNAAYTQQSLWARVRSPGGDWSGAENISGWVPTSGPSIRISWSTGVAPDGTAWALWTAIDSGVSGDNRQVKVARRSPSGFWQSEVLTPFYEPEIGFLDMDIGPDGDLAALWVPCAGSYCHVRVRRRPSGSTNWEPCSEVDSALGRIDTAYALVGQDGLTVIVWNEGDAPTPSSWTVKARAYRSTPAPGAWDPSPTDISGSKASLDLSSPVMDLGGTITVAWVATGSVPSNKAIYSATRTMGGTWNSPPAQISTERGGYMTYPPTLAVGQNGTVAATWTHAVTTTQEILLANARDAGSTWGTEAQLANGTGLLSLSDLKIRPDGTIMALWWKHDYSRPAMEDEGVFWSTRQPNSIWGSGGQGRVGDWCDNIFGAALGLRDDGSAVVLWSVGDSSRPAGQQWAVQAATKPPGDTWSTPTTISDWYKLALVQDEALVSGPGGRPVGAMCYIERDATLSDAVFYSEWPVWRIYVPVVLRDFQQP